MPAKEAPWRHWLARAEVRWRERHSVSTSLMQVRSKFVAKNSRREGRTPRLKPDLPMYPKTARWRGLLDDFLLTRIFLSFLPRPSGNSDGFAEVRSGLSPRTSFDNLTCEPMM